MQVDEDNARTSHLNQRGWTVMRFWNTEVAENSEGVVGSILPAVSRYSTHPQPLPSREGSG